MQSDSTGFLQVNQSEMKAFMRCPRKWALEYVFGWKERGPRQGHLNVGTIVHAALESYYQQQKPEHAFVCMDSMKAAAVQAMLLDDPAYEQIVKDYALSELVVEGYLEWLEETGVDADLVVQQTEQTLRMQLMPGVTLFGTIDLIVGQYDQRIFMDHKTCQSFDIISRMLPQNFQLLTYSALLRANGVKVDGVQYNVLKKSKRTARATPPFYKREPVVINDRQIDNHLRHMRETAAQMQVAQEWNGPELDETAAVLYPVVQDECTWQCKYQKVCPMLDDGSDWKGALEFIFDKEERQ